jgi:hypothetical protein
MTAFLLWFLATLDGAFTGYREAAGRSALIDKRRYFRRAMIKGALFAQIAVVIAAVVVIVSVMLVTDRQDLVRAYDRAGAHMLFIYVPYAVMMLVGFLFRLIPSVDIRSITSTVIFGPFTLIRPVVAVLGLAYGIASAARPATIIPGLIVLSMMLSLETVLTFWRKQA